MYALKKPSPIGELILIEKNGAISHLLLPGSFLPSEVEFVQTSLLKKASLQLDEYFAGKRREFDLPLLPEGTEFRKKVWQALYEIPYGVTVSYGDIAKAVGNPKAARAVGGANNKNPIAIIIPCHRVIGSNGSLVGYGGGLPIKEFLLRLEGIS